MIQTLALCLTALAVTCMTSADTVASWDFAKDAARWQPRASTVAVARVEATRPGGKGPGALHIKGALADAWNYATSEQHPMTAGQLYRVSAWLRVDRLGDTTPAPFLKCEFVAKDRTQQIGRVSTDTYDTNRIGQWQELSCEFMAPANTVAFWLALEKGNDQRCEIDALLGDVQVEHIAKLSVYEKYRINPLPASLAAVKGVHPRLYLTAARVAELREAIKTTHADLWAALRQQADAAVKSGPPKYVLRDRYSGDEQLWQREVGNAMPTVAMAWVLSGDAKYLNAARDWALASCGYATWGLGRIDGMDLAAGHQLFGLAMVYDWCYADLGEPARKTIRETLTRRASATFEAAATGQTWWGKSYLQNHLWVSACGLAAAGFALCDEVPDANLWIGLPLSKFRTTMAALGPDGASHEGVGYWQYGAEYMLKFMELDRSLLGESLYDNAWWRNTASYAQYLSLPRKAWTRSDVIVDIADCPRGNWYGPDHILRRLAAQYGDGHAQWLANEVASAKVDAASARWLNLVWYDAKVAPKPPTDRHTLRHFEDMGLVSARSDWSGDESLVVLKCGPFIGHEAVDHFTYDPGGGHVHPDANHFVVFGNGEWLVRDDGYRAKWTGQHNTLLVDGKGQMGEGNMWFDGGVPLRAKAHPRIIAAESSAALDHLAGDATPSYPATSGLRRYVRHLLYLKPDILIVLDDITADHERDLELRFHPEAKEAEAGSGTVLVHGKLSNLRLRCLTPEGVAFSAGDLAAIGRNDAESQPMYTVALKAHRATWRNAVALSWCPKAQQPAEIALQVAGDVWTVIAGERIVRFDWKTGKAEAVR